MDVLVGDGVQVHFELANVKVGGSGSSGGVRIIVFTHFKNI